MEKIKKLILTEYRMKGATLVVLLLIVNHLAGQKPKDYNHSIQEMYNNTVELITPDELEMQLQKGQQVYILDSREKKEFKVSHISGSINVGYERFSLESVSGIQKNAEIVVYCSLGVRSERIGEKLKEAGYTNVKNLYGGIFEWLYHEHPIVDMESKPTLKVHTYDKSWSKWLLKGEKVY